jgi:hypothetical protein
LIPSVRRTWAPRGQTPLLRHRARRDRISVISGLSVSRCRRHCGLYFLLSLKNIKHPEVCAFLRDLLRHLRGPVIVIWDTARFTAATRFAPSKLAIPAFTCTDSRATPPNSIPMRASGSSRSARSPTDGRTRRMSYSDAFARAYRAFSDLPRFCIAACADPISPFFDSDIAIFILMSIIEKE